LIAPLKTTGRFHDVLAYGALAHGALALATITSRSRPVPRGARLGIDTGSRPWIGISPNSARVRLDAETTVFEYVQT
jgi:hypothetical protein